MAQREIPIERSVQFLMQGIQARRDIMEQGREALRKLSKTVRPEILEPIERMLFPLSNLMPAKLEIDDFSQIRRKYSDDLGDFKKIYLDADLKTRSTTFTQTIYLSAAFRALETLSEIVKPEELEPIRKALQQLDADRAAFAAMRTIHEPLSLRNLKNVFPSPENTKD